MSTICMKLDPGIHKGMHLVCFSNTRCDRNRACVARGRHGLKSPACAQVWQCDVNINSILNALLRNCISPKSDN
jgi:hypothetical protein